MPIEQRNGIQSIGVGDPAAAASGDSSEPPANIVATAQFRFFRDEHAKKRAANVSKTDDSDVVERNVSLFLFAIAKNPYRVAASSFCATDAMCVAAISRTRAVTMICASASF